MTLSDTAIAAERDRGAITLRPFDPSRLGPNSYDVTLAPTLGAYPGGIARTIARCLPARFARRHWRLAWWVGKLVSLVRGDLIDPKEAQTLELWTIPPEGQVLYPGELYLASTAEWTATDATLLSAVDGKSSLGRLGLGVHVTAGRGDAGFRGPFTLEITVVRPMVVYATMPVAQLTYHRLEGEVARPYGARGGSKYQDQGGGAPVPVASKMHRNRWEGHEPRNEEDGR